MAAGVTEVIKVVLPILLDNLLASAIKLNENDALAVSAPAVKSQDSDQDKMEQIQNETNEYLKTNWYDNFGYEYKAQRTKPPKNKELLVGLQEIVVYNPSGQGIENIKGHLQKVFQDSVDDGVMNELADNLASLFKDRFKEESLSWTPFYKAYHIDDTTVDVFTVTSTARDTNNNLTGILNYFVVAYK